MHVLRFFAQMLIFIVMLQKNYKISPNFTKSAFLRCTHITPIFKTQTDLGQLNHVSHTFRRNSGYLWISGISPFDYFAGHFMASIAQSHPFGSRQSHIGCICLAFLHCAFSNVSSNGLHERMHSHIGSIYLAFLHCAFSNASSNGLHQKRHSHIGCICLTFPHCAFSNVSSN